MTNELQASHVKWQRLRRLMFTTTLAVVGVLAILALAGGGVLLDADGMVTRRSVSIASPWPDVRVREVNVRPGDWVEAGQKIAVVESATMSRSIAELAAEKARVSSRLAQLEARKTVVKALLPLASASAKETESFLANLQNANKNGLVVTRSLQEMSAAKVQAMDKVLTLQAEETSLETEIRSNRDALEQLSTAYADLQQAYGSGVLAAPVSGYIGSRVAMVGEVLSSGSTLIANIYTGPNHVLAYIPENYWFDMEEGQQVSVRARGRSIAGHIERILPVTEALPPEFQLPNRVRARGQVVRVTLSGDDNFAVHEKIKLTACHLKDCHRGVGEIILAALPSPFSSRRRVQAAHENAPERTTKAGPSALSSTAAVSAAAAASNQSRPDGAGSAALPK
jgi:multidrug resistance efflux pump